MDARDRNKFHEFAVTNHRTGCSTLFLCSYTIAGQTNKECIHQLSTSDATPLCLEVKNLRCERGDRLLINQLGFSLRAGQGLLVEGANGSGKTTLLRTLCGLSQPTEGTIHWCGEDIRHVRPEFQAQLSYVGHLPGIKDDLTPMENLRVASGLHHAREDADPMAALDKVGLFGFEDLPCRTLSAGQRRRVALARLMILNTRLWILDEPLTAIDRKGVAMLAEVMKSHMENGGLLILTTHQPLDLGTNLTSLPLGNPVLNQG